MKTIDGRRLIITILFALFAGMLTPALAKSTKGGKGKEWATPILMEESTVRGKVVILETRRTDRGDSASER